MGASAEHRPNSGGPGGQIHSRNTFGPRSFEEEGFIAII